ncbi:MAG: NAD-dependent epimerase/dehydratase family protein [Candidatus Obscuribacterales bacterium]|nr:NAD-dependent epimerase/dehydratase family protein [Candidatus Obscuribacterales bacterium]
MKALIIGGNGFIGSNLADCLLKAGHKVTSFDRYPSRYREADPRINYVYGDFANHGEVQEVVKGNDWIFHLAYTTLPASSNEDPAFDVRSNIIDTLQLLEACRESQVKKVVFISSGGTVYGVPQSLPIHENHPTEPICSYGITKLTIEKYLHLYHHLHNLDYVVVRLANPYGELQNPQAKQGAIAVFLGNVMQGKPITIWGDGEVVRDYIYIGDAAEALLKAAEYCPDENEPRVFNVGSGCGQSLNEIVRAIRAVVGKDLEVVHHPARSADVPANVLDIERAKKCLDWQPEINLESGIRKTWDWLCKVSKN